MRTVGLLLSVMLSVTPAFNIAGRGSHGAGSRSRQSSMVEPLTMAAVAFATGAVPPSVVAAQKDIELKKTSNKLATAEAELSDLRVRFDAALTQLEINARTTEMSLNEMLELSVRKARSRKDEVEAMKQQYEEQITALKDLVGDYNDRLEFQQNRMKRNNEVTESARAESNAYMERANLLQEQYYAAQAMIEQLQAEVDANPVINFFKALSGTKKLA